MGCATNNSAVRPRPNTLQKTKKYSFQVRMQQPKLNTTASTNYHIELKQIGLKGIQTITKLKKQHNPICIIVFFSELQTFKTISVYTEGVYKLHKVRCANSLSSIQITPNLQIIASENELTGFHANQIMSKRCQFIIELRLNDLQVDKSIMDSFGWDLIVLKILDIRGTYVKGEWLDSFSRVYDQFIVNETTHNHQTNFYKKINNMRVNCVEIEGKVKEANIVVLLIGDLFEKFKKSDEQDSPPIQCRFKLLIIEQTQEEDNNLLYYMDKAKEKEINIEIYMKKERVNCERYQY